ncbi:hypothetical protein A3464_18725 [Enterobacter genomosp. O]|uniref:hypothetical protein n=1 Tax=Enterobacter genomosp. O TaxID=2364150 RepID=UPI0007B38889|nr:hypothetical protein [Enterobacter genomosp. O]KZQ38519.1 hypothetical protein A3464_18725 [Enterobacter genomosp. O]
MKKPTYEELESRLELIANEFASFKARLPQLKVIPFDGCENMDDVSLAEDIGFNLAINQMWAADDSTPLLNSFISELKAKAIEVCADDMASENNIGSLEVDAMYEYASLIRKGKS